MNPIRPRFGRARAVSAAAAFSLLASLPLCAFSPAAASPAGFSFAGIGAPHVSLSPFMETAIGEAREYVYKKDQYLSELVWDMKPMISFGLTANAGWDRGLQLSAEAVAGIPSDTGEMEDSDWLNLIYGGTNWKTTYSKHTANLKYAWQLKAEAGWEFELPLRIYGSRERITVTPGVSFRYLTWKWHATGGYLQHTSMVDGSYPAWSADMTKVACYGTPITYLQEFWMPAAGLSVSVPVGETVRISAGFSGTLWVWCNGVDTHYGATSAGSTFWDYTDSSVGTVYYDILSGGWLAEPELGVRWDRFERVSLFLEGRWTLIGGLRGDTAEQSTEGGSIAWARESSGEGGGAALDTAVIRLGAEYRIR
jgi:outer membrane protease